MVLLSQSFVSALTFAAAALPLAFSHSIPKRTDYHPQPSPGFKCHIPDGYESCYSAENRLCWMRNKRTGKEYNVSTNYEVDYPPGIERYYQLEVTEADVSPDGFIRKAQVLKKLGESARYPGAMIEACWGDTLVVDVTNRVKTNGTTIHWHGIRMLGENEMDGVNGVTQCPISQDDTYRYKFHLRQYGHTWYHSHYSAQYTDGVVGTMLIHGPQTGNWDVEWETPVVIADWFHTSAYELFQQALTLPPQAQSIVVNGTGRHNPTGTGAYFEHELQRGKKHLIRLVNGATDFHFDFSIDNHILEVITVDFVPVKPFFTNSLSVGIGQRYGIIVHANQTASPNGKYWMRAEYTTSSGCNLEQANFPSLSPDTQRIGILTYSDAKSSPPYQYSSASTNGTAPSNSSLPSTSRWPVTVGCTDPTFTPQVSWIVKAPQNDIIKNAYYAGLDLQNKTHGAFRWELLDTPLWLNYSNPTIVNLKNTTWNPEYAIEPFNAQDPQGFVYMIINSGGPKHAVGGTHPIHLHGHDFAVISQGPGLVDPANPPAFNLNNPPRRDVAMLPDGGHLVIAFKTDNPGVWIMHCHIGWHAGHGLALQVLERQGRIAQSIGSLEPVKKGCKKWTDWMRANPTGGFTYENQEDSGI